MRGVGGYAAGGDSKEKGRSTSWNPVTAIRAFGWGREEGEEMVGYVGIWMRCSDDYKRV